jgi:hypothetical protein
MLIHVDMDMDEDIIKLVAAQKAPIYSSAEHTNNIGKRVSGGHDRGHPPPLQSPNDLTPASSGNTGRFEI